MSSTPERGYSWAPFAPGHELSLQHGAYSPRRVEPLAEQMRTELVTLAPWLAVAAFAPTVRALALAEARCRLLQAFVDERGLIDEEGVLRVAPAQAMLDREERKASKLREQLGLTPVAWASLRRALTDDPDVRIGGLEALKQAGHALAAGTTPTDTDGDDDDHDHH